MATERAGVRPNFFVIGAQKAGTTFLCEQLRSHDKISFSHAKETFFFTQPKIEDVDFEGYLTKFFSEDAVKPGAAFVADGTTRYFQSKCALRSMTRFLGSDFKAIVSLREPVGKSISWYMHNYRRGRFDSTERLFGWHFVKRASYARHLRRWTKQLGQERLHVQLYDTLKEDPRAFVNSSLDFLGLERFAEVPSVRVNEGFMIVRRGDFIEPLLDRQQQKELGGIPRLAIGDIEKLHMRFRKDVRETQKITGLDLSAWNEIPQFEPAEKYDHLVAERDAAAAAAVAEKRKQRQAAALRKKKKKKAKAKAKKAKAAAQKPIVALPNPPVTLRRRIQSGLRRRVKRLLGVG